MSADRQPDVWESNGGLPIAVWRGYPSRSDSVLVLIGEPRIGVGKGTGGRALIGGVDPEHIAKPGTDH